MVIDTVPIWVWACAAFVLLNWMAIDTITRYRDNREEIACVAIKYADIGVLALPAPARHHHVMWARLFVDGQPSHPKDGIQGFLTTHGRFVDRMKALKIATKRDQIVKKHGSPIELYSEDMWDTPPEAWGWVIAHHSD